MDWITPFTSSSTWFDDISSGAMSFAYRTSLAFSSFRSAMLCSGVVTHTRKNESLFGYPIYVLLV
jgi:hypothetical protein